MKKRLGCLLLSLLMLLSLLPLEVYASQDAQVVSEETALPSAERTETAEEIPEEAESAEEETDVFFAKMPKLNSSGITWSLVNGTLTISGTGAMTNLSDYRNAPWFSDRDHIKRIVVENGVTSIGNQAFEHCEKLETISIADSVLSIGEDAFAYCCLLKSVAANGVTLVNKQAFYGCEAMTSASFPALVTLGDQAFYGCKLLKTFDVPAKTTSINTSAFTGCESLESITVAEYNTKYRSDDGILCAKGSGLTPGGVMLCPQAKTGKYIIKSGTQSISKNAFANSHLAEIVIPETILSTGDGAFSGFTGTKTQAVKSGSCGDNVSYYLTQEGVLYIYGTGAMADYDISGTTNRAPWYSTYHSSVTSVIVEEGVTRLGDAALAYCENLTGVSLPSGLLTIGEDAFRACSSLAGVTIPDTVTTIDDDAFRDCTALKSIVIPSDVKQIADGLFYNCIALESVTLPDGLTGIEAYAFYNCQSLTEMMMPDTVKSIGSYAFKNCYDLETLGFSTGITFVLTGTFDYCSDLTDVYYNGTQSEWVAITVQGGNTCLTNATLHALTAKGTFGPFGAYQWKLTSDGTLTVTGGTGSYDRAGAPWYSYRTSINKVVLEEGVTSVGNDAFFGLTNLTTVVLPESVTAIGIESFENCTKLTTIDLSHVKSLNACAFTGCTALQSVQLCSTMTTLREYAFQNCIALTSVTIPGSVGKVEDAAFMGCTALKTVTVGEGITWLGRAAFSGCTALESVSLPSTLVTLGYSTYSKNETHGNVFDGCTKLKTVNIPVGVKTLYKYTFRGCTALTELVLPSSVTWVESSVFYGMGNTQNVVFTGNAPGFDTSAAFLNCSATMHYPANNTTWTAAKRAQYGGNVTWVDDYYGNEVESGNFGTGNALHWQYTDTDCLIISGAGVMPDGSAPTTTKMSNDPWAKYADSAAMLIIDSGITVIGAYNFCGFEALREIRFADTVEEIRTCAFLGTSALRGITFPDSLITIRLAAFRNSGLQTLTVPAHITTIEDNAFTLCESLTTVTLEKGAVWRTSLFNDCTALTEYRVAADDPNYTVADGMLLNKAGTTLLSYPCGKGTTRTVLPKTVTTIANYAFASLYGLAGAYQYDVVLPEGLQTIQGAGITANTGAWTKPYFHVCGSKEDFAANVSVLDYSADAWEAQETAGYIHYMECIPTVDSNGTNGWYCPACDEMIVSVSPVIYPVGNGTPQIPYQISTAAQLDRIRYYPDCCFVLTADITFNASDFAFGGTYYNEGTGWQPIGDYEEPFTGTLDGAGHAISGLQGTLGGLFGYNSGTVRNLRVVNQKLFNAVGLYSGAVANTNNNGATITRCYVCSAFTENAIPTSYEISNVGGVVGNNMGTVDHCRNGGLVCGASSHRDGWFAVGGIVGKGYASFCINEGTVIAGSTATLSYCRVSGISGAGDTYGCRNSGSCVKRAQANYNYYPGMFTQTQYLSGSNLSLLESSYGVEYDFVDEWMINETGAVPQGVMDANGQCFSKQSYTAPTCLASGTSLLVDDAGKTRNVILPIQAHKMTETKYASATCLASGTNAYWTCSECHKVYADAEGTQETTVAAQVIAPLGHKLTKTKYASATCLASGTNAYWTCSECHKVYADAEGTQETTVAAQVIAPLGHATETDAALEATYALPGRTEGCHCSRCKAILTPQEVVPAMGVTIQGTVTTPIPTDTVFSVSLLRGTQVIAAGITESGIFTLSPDPEDTAKRVVAGTYTLRIEGTGYVTWEEPLAIPEDSPAVQKLTFPIVTYGDGNGDGVGIDTSGADTEKITDLAALYEYLSGKLLPNFFGNAGEILSRAIHSYLEKVLDLNGDDRLNILDYQAFYERIAS